MENQRGKNPYFWDCQDFAVQLSLCPWGFLNHLRGTDDRFLLAPAFAWPGIRKYNHLSRSHGQSQEARLCGIWPPPSATGSCLLSHLSSIRLGSRRSPQPGSGSGDWAVLQTLSPLTMTIHIHSDGQTQQSFRIRCRSHFVHLFIDSTCARHGARY